MVRRRPSLLWPLAAPLVALSLAGCFEKEQAAAPPAPRAVAVVPIVFAPHRTPRVLSGIVRPRIETSLAFRVGGKVRRRLVDVGDLVKAGDAIATLDGADLTLQLQSAEAELAAARSAVAQADADMTRVATLALKGWATGAERDRQTAAKDEARGRLLKAERAVDLARDQLSYVTLRAEADGVVTVVSVENGQVVASGDQAIRVARLDEKEAAVAVPETLIADVRRSKATVTLWSDPDHRLPAHLRELSPIADPATRTFAARFSVPDAPGGMALGMTATVTLTEDDPAPVAKVPLSAIADGGHGPVLWTVSADGALAAKPVVVETYAADTALVRSGVANGDRVVALGAQKLDAGQRVRVVSAGE